MNSNNSPNAIRQQLITSMTADGWNNAVSFVESCEDDEILDLAMKFLTPRAELLEELEWDMVNDRLTLPPPANYGDVVELSRVSHR